MDSASGSGKHETNLSNCLFNLEANMSISGTPKLSIAAENSLSHHFHSTFSLQCLERKSASFSTPGRYVLDRQIFTCMHQIHMSCASLFKETTFLPMFEYRQLHLYCLNVFVHAKVFCLCKKISMQNKQPKVPDS